MAKRAGIAAAAIICACAAWFLYSLIVKSTGGIPCIIHLLTGLYCPGCGTTRALIELSKLNFYSAFRYNPLLIIASPLLAVFALKSLYSYIRVGIVSPGKYDMQISIGVAFLAVVYMIARNTQHLAFLAPVGA